MKRTGTPIYQIIKKGDGTFYPNIKNEGLGIECMIGSKYFNTYKEALSVLQEEIEKDKQWDKNNTKEVAYQYPPELF